MTSINGVILEEALHWGDSRIGVNMPNKDVKAALDAWLLKKNGPPTGAMEFGRHYSKKKKKHDCH